LAANWQHDSRRITLVGADNLEEIALIMAELERALSHTNGSKPQ
jgi:hypothetical protein